MVLYAFIHKSIQEFILADEYYEIISQIDICLHFIHIVFKFFQKEDSDAANKIKPKFA